MVQRGIFSSEFQLSSQPNLGDWTIHGKVLLLLPNFQLKNKDYKVKFININIFTISVSAKTQKETQQFTIAEYVLPKFNVDINLPTYATFNSSKIVARIRAT